MDSQLYQTMGGFASQVEGHILHRLAGRLCNLEVIVGDTGLIIKGRSRTYRA